MEKIDLIVWRRDAVGPAELAERLGDALRPLLDLADHVTVHTADTEEQIPEPTLLLGRGPDIAAVITMWLDSIDDRGDLLEAVSVSSDTSPGDGVDAYLVTESVPQRRTDRGWPDGERSPGITHFTCFPQPQRLSDEDFYRGWHEVHTPASFRLHPLRWEYVRDAVVRPLTAGSRPLGAIVFERFRAIEDYTDPARLYGPPETFEETMRDLPLYADFEDIDSRPLHETILR